MLWTTPVARRTCSHNTPNFSKRAYKKDAYKKDWTLYSFLRKQQVLPRYISPVHLSLFFGSVAAK